MKQNKFDLEKVTHSMKEERFVEALSSLEFNLAGQPNHFECLYLAAVCSRYLRNFDSAHKYLERLLKVNPDMGRAYQELGHLNRMNGKMRSAIANYRQACELNPALIASWNYLLDYYKRNKNKQAADHAAEQIEKLKSIPNILLYISQILNEGKLAIAEQKCREFLKKNPTNTYAMSLLSDIADRLGHFDDTEILLKNAVKFKPEDGELRMKYALILRKKQKFKETMEQVNILCEKFPDNLSYQAHKASEVMQNGDHEKAIKLFNSIIKKSPHNYNALTSKGHALKTLGKTEQAIYCYKSAYKKKPDHGDAFYSLANLKTYSFTANETNKMREQLQRVDLTLKDKVYFHFALAQSCEANGDFDEAFINYKKGNEIKNKQSNYSIKQMDDELQAQIDICDETFFKNLGPGGFETNDPIFILGLPRAGSTLIEQILASHSMVDGTLELPNILSTAQNLRGDDIYGKKGNYPKTMKTLSLEKRLELGEMFINDTKIHRKDAPRFTDKMPNNFRHIGLIHLIMPNAKIIDARRYPLDCCFSMFKQLFAQGQEFTYGLKEAASYYNSYVKLMDHWDRVLPNKVLRVNNEDIVDNLESEVIRLLDFLDLPFEESCVRFYETDRSVRTPSSEQVRKPVNKAGMGRWKPYAKNLKSLVENIDKKLLKQEDIELIEA